MDVGDADRGDVDTDGVDARRPVPRPLLDATADLVLARLPLDRPLWRARLLVDDRRRVVAVVVVAHHVLADGMGGLAVLGALADGIEPAAAAEQAPGPDHGASGATEAATDAATASVATASDALPPWSVLARDAWGSRARGVPALKATKGPPRQGRHRAGAAPTGARRAVQPPRPHAGRRRLEVVTADLAGVHAAALARGATVNDVVVTAVTGALVDLLARRGEHVEQVVVSVPVSRRGQGEASSLGNATGVVPVRVPAVADPGARLAAVVAQRGRVRAPGRGGSAAVLTPAFRVLAATGAFQAFIDHQRLVHTFVTNVRGPAERLRLAGAEVVSVVPVAVNPGNVAVSFDVLSYAGTLALTLVVDPGLVQESAWLADRVAEGLTAFT